jgi:hypothetical protein
MHVEKLTLMGDNARVRVRTVRAPCGLSVCYAWMRLQNEWESVSRVIGDHAVKTVRG